MQNRYAAILPHTKIFGGVKRFLDLGNIFISRGIDFVIFTPTAEEPDWFDFKGKIDKIENIHHYQLDILFLTEYEYIRELHKADARLKVYYCVLEIKILSKLVKEKGIDIFVNSESLYQHLRKKYGVTPFKAIGGIDTDKFSFQPVTVKEKKDVFYVMVYGRFYIKRKGTMKVVKACERLYRNGYNIHLLLFDTPTDARAMEKVKNFKCGLPFTFYIDHPVEKLADLYHEADLFVSAERRAGWSNTSIEAMSCGVPVVGTTSGTKNFLIDDQTGLVVWRHSYFIQRAIKKMINDNPLRKRFSEAGRNKVHEFSWKALATCIQEFVQNSLGNKARANNA